MGTERLGTGHWQDIAASMPTATRSVSSRSTRSTRSNTSNTSKCSSSISTSRSNTSSKCSRDTQPTQQRHSTSNNALPSINLHNRCSFLRDGNERSTPARAALSTSTTQPKLLSGNRQYQPQPPPSSVQGAAPRSVLVMHSNDPHLILIYK